MKAITQEFVVVITGLLLSLIFNQEAFAQKTVLIAEHQKSNKQVVLVVGQTVFYKTNRANNYAKARIAAISDSTISFEQDIPGLVTTTSYKDLVAFKIPRSAVRELISLAVIIPGFCLIVVGIAYTLSGKSIETTTGIEATAVGFAVTACGFGISKSKKLFFL